MYRITAALVVVLMLCAMPALAEEGIPDLKGAWTVEVSEFHVKGKGIIGPGTTAVWKIENQEGRIFHGVVEWQVEGRDHEGQDNFSGVIAKDNKTLYIAGHNEGLRIGNIEGPDTITMYFIVPGGDIPRAGFAELEREK